MRTASTQKMVSFLSLRMFSYEITTSALNFITSRAPFMAPWIIDWYLSPPDLRSPVISSCFSKGLFIIFRLKLNPFSVSLYSSYRHSEAPM
jgi:hypothetical protein